MPKIIATINKKTGQLTVKAEGVSGPECYELTRPLEEGLGMDRACSIPTQDLYNVEKNEQQVGGS